MPYSKELNKMRYIKAFEGLLAYPELKIFLATISSYWLIVQELFEPMDPLLIAAILLVTALDLFTGIMKSVRRGIPITSFGLRQFGVKLIEYGVVVMFFTIGSSAFGDIPAEGWVSNMLSFMSNVHYFAYFWVFWTEGLSILENLGGKKSRFYELWKMIDKQVFNRGITLDKTKSDLKPDKTKDKED